MMWPFGNLRRIRRFVLSVFGPLVMFIALIWALSAIPFLNGLGGDPLDSNGRIVLSDLMNESLRRDHLPTLERLRILGTSDDFASEPLRGAVVRGAQLIAVGTTQVIPIDLESGAVGQAIHTDLGSVIGQVRSVTTTSQSDHDIWISGSDGLFARFDLTRPGQHPTRVVGLDDLAVKPVWFGNQVAAGGYFHTTLLRFYEVQPEPAAGKAQSAPGVGRWTYEEPAATLGTPSLAAMVKETGFPLYPGLDWDMSVFLNRVSLAVRPDQRLLAVAFNLSDRVHIFDRDGRLIRAIASPVEVKLDFDIKARPEGGHTLIRNSETRLSYLDVDAGGDLIVALFSGRSRGDYENAAFYGDELHVFRWDGTFVGTWKLPEAVVTLRLDEVRQRIYAIRERPFMAIVELDAGPIYQSDVNIAN